MSSYKFIQSASTSSPKQPRNKLLESKLADIDLLRKMAASQIIVLSLDQIALMDYLDKLLRVVSR